MPSLLSKVVGHQSVRDWVTRQIQNQSLPSSMIFYGPTGVGKSLMARAMLQELNCPESQPACGVCSSCLRVEEDQNEMVYWLEAGDKKNIGVDQVREARSFYQLKTHHQGRLVIIDQAHRLSIPAANSLLKALEEPSEKTHFVLITDQIRRLLPTVRSRSQIVKFAALAAAELASFQKFNSLSLDWSDGCLQMAQDLEQPETVQKLNDSIQLFYSVICESPDDWKKRAPWFFNSNQDRDFCLNIWKQALHKRLHNQSDNLEFIPTQLGKISRLFESLENLQRDIGANVDKVLALENFYYSARSVMMNP